MFATFALIASCGGSDGESSTNTELPTSAATDPPTTDPLATQPPATEPASTDAPPIEDPPPPEIVDVFSDDGELGLSYTSRLGGSGATIRLLDPAEWPAEVAGGDNVDGVKIFELEPDGAVFAEPVTVTRRLDIAAFEALELGPFDVPLVTMLTQNDAGEYSVLDDLTIVRVGPDLYVSGSTTHFSPIIVSNENRMIPWGPGGGGFPQAPPLSETYLDPDEYLEIMRGLMEVPPAQVIVEESRYLSGQELYDFVHTVIDEQQAADSEESDRGIDAFAGYELFDDDGAMIEGIPLDPGPISPSDGAYRAERFGTSFPTIPVSLLPSTSALTGDPNATIALAVWMPALVLTMEALIGAPEEPEPSVTEPPVIDPPINEAVADCLMYLELYPALLEIDPFLEQLCETDVDAARSRISVLLDELGL